MKEKIMDILSDVTKTGIKIKVSEYRKAGLYPVIDQGKEFISGYTNKKIGLANNVPYIIFGDHTCCVKYIEFPLFLGADGVKLLKVTNRNYLSKYVYYSLLYRPIKSNEYARHFKEMKNRTINFCNLKEQQRVINSLDSVTECLIEKKKQVVELDSLVKSRFMEMFGDPKTNTKNLAVMKLAEICKNISAGGDKPKEVSETKNDEFCFPIYSNGEKNDGLYGWSKTYKIEKPAVTVSGRGTIGYSSFRKKGKFTPIVRLITLEPSEEINPLYLTHFLNFEREVGLGSGVQQLTVPMIKQKKIIVPDIVLQNEFAFFATLVDKS